MENKNQFKPKFGEREKFYPLTTEESILPTKKFFMLYLNGGVIFCEKTTEHDKLGLRFYVINGNWHGRLKPDLALKVEYTKYETLFEKGNEKYIIVLNHDALAVFKDLYKKTEKNIVLIANISDTPWLIKQLAVNEKLEEMYKESKIPLINDSNGAFINSLGLNDNTQNKYFIYKLNIDGTIVKMNEGFVELNILEKGISEELSKKSLEEIKKLF